MDPYGKLFLKLLSDCMSLKVSDAGCVKVFLGLVVQCFRALSLKAVCGKGSASFRVYSNLHPGAPEDEKTHRQPIVLNPETQTNKHPNP